MTIGGDNYGWPVVSWGDQYSGIPIPDHDTHPEFNAPELYWVPTVAPSGLIIYDGTMFPVELRSVEQGRTDQGGIGEM